MAWRRIENYLRLFCAMACLIVSSLVAASEYRGRVTFGGLPVPGAAVTATQGGRKVVTTTDQQGLYSFPELLDGTWTIEVQMLCFSTIKQDIVTAPNAPAANWELKLLSLDQIMGKVESILSATGVAPLQVERKPTKPADNQAREIAVPRDDLSQRTADGLLINGSVNKGAASPFAQLAAFGNDRNGAKGRYNGGIGITLNNSALDAKPFSLTGLNLPKATYKRIAGVATLGGPLKIPQLFEHSPIFFAAYQWMRSRDASAQATLVPDLAERGGDFSHKLDSLGQPIQIFSPATGLPFPGNTVR
jgi:hypothetical protein